MARIILASASPRRRHLLSQLNLTFDVIPSNVDESFTGKEPVQIAENLALQKAADVAKGKQNSLIIGADTIVVHDDNILNKPETPSDARKMLSQLSDTFHFVFTGVALIQTDENGRITSKKTFSEQTKVFFDALEPEEMEAYIKSGNPMDKAGSYGIQDDLGALFVKRIEGDYYNVVGFPLNRFYRELKIFKPDVAKGIYDKI